MRSQSQDAQPPRSGEVEEVQEPQPPKQPILFDWKNRWLRGHEYEHILCNVELYCAQFGIQKYPAKTHPPCIYDRPVNGKIYFVEGRGLGSQFGFPRVQGRKRYRWKKMNFLTNLPKTNPRVTYIVASTTNCLQLSEHEEPLFRMHAVIPYDRQLLQTCGYILCHILEIKARSKPDSLGGCLAQGKFDFYKLFAFLHNATLARS